MKIILKENVENLGKRGDVVNVKDGYARNYLLPHAMAMRWTPGAIKILEQERRVYEAKQVKAKDDALAIAEKIAAVELSFSKRSGDQDVLYGSVTQSDLADALKEKGVVVEKRRILLHEPIKRLGDYEVPVRLHADVAPILRIHVVKEE
jgi:large subunit ribosomal protein L9